MRKHFLILMLLTLLPLAGWAEAVTLLTTTPQARAYDGTAPTITVKATAAGDPLEGTWSTDDGVLAEGVPTEAAGTYLWTQTEGDATATFVITKVQIVYYLTGRTYAVGDAPDVTNHYSKASGNFVEGEELADYAEFDFASSGNDALDLDDNGRFTTVKTYNITALRVKEVANVHQNYDFRFTSTATIVVTKKSIANFVWKAADVPAQTYTSEQITFATAPAIYATVADRDAETPIALDPDNYTVSYGENVNVAYDPEHAGTVINGGTIIYTAKAASNYEGTLTIPFKIQPRELVEVTVDELPHATYAYGGEIIPTLTNKVHGEDADGNSYDLVLDQDFTVDYGEELLATNVNAGDAVGEIAVAFGNFTFAAAAEIDDVTFTIDRKNLGNEDITVTPVYASYAYTAEQIQPNFTVEWTIGEADNDITEFTQADWTNNANVEVGKGYITVVPKENADPQNYTGSKTVAFDIIPTDLVSAGVTITLQKENPEWDGEDPETQWIAATYQYEGRDIKPGTTDGDGRLLVKKGDVVLKEGVDYEIVSYGDDVDIYTGDNKNASKEATVEPAAQATRGTVTIKGLGNYGAIDALSEPITLSQIFTINKRTLTFTATPVTTTFGVAPKFAYESDAKDDLGGVVTYPTVQFSEYNGEDWTGWSAYEGGLTALEVTAATPVDGSKKYQYKPSWEVYNAEALDEEQKAAKEAAEEPYDTDAQVAARVNYDLENVVYEFGAITVNNATWIIVPDNVSKKYKVTDAALVAAHKFTYKVYNGTKAPENLVENPVFDEDSAPVIGRSLTAQGENVVNGGYVISVLNANGNVADGTYGEAQKKVAKTGYTIVPETATLTIDPFPITITANNQSVFYGEEPNTQTLETSKVKDVNGDEDGFGNLLTVTFSPVMYGDQTLIDRKDLKLTLTLDESYDGKVGPHTGVLIPAIDNPNFVLASPAIKGNVEVVAAGDLLLSQTDDDLVGKIAAAKGEEPKVITFDDIAMLEKQWYAIVLPFETTPLELSTKLNTYVVVNVLKSSTVEYDPEDDRDEAIVNFGLEMDKIEAGVPFLIKPAKDVNWKNAAAFNAKVTDVITPAKGEKGNSIFSATYETNKSIKWGLDWETGDADPDMKYRWLSHSTDGNRSNGKPYGNAWWNCKTNAHDLLPMEAFLILDPAAQGARIFVEDFENGTTAIQSLNADEINGLKVAEGWYTIDGIKLQSMPTEKGVYINNGKKVVIK